MDIKKLERCMKRYDLGDISIQTTPAEITIVSNDNRGRYATVKKKSWLSPTATLCEAISLYMRLESGIAACVADHETIQQSASARS
jgi:hypothetical protein